jgi:hypothetical protein
MRWVAAAVTVAGLGSACTATRPADIVPRPKPPAPPTALTTPKTAAAVIDGADSVTGYDPEPLLASLRPDALAYADRSGDLPLYDLDVSLEAGGAAFALTETVWLTEREGRPLDDFVLRLYANAPAAAAQRAAPVRLVSGNCVGGAPCAVSAPSPTVISVHFDRPLPPHGRVVVRLKLTGLLDRIDSSRTTMLGQSLGAISGLLGGGGDSGHGDYGLLAVGDGITQLGGFYAVVARRRGGEWEREDASLDGDLGPDEMSYVRARIELDPGTELASVGAVVKDETTTEAAVSRRHVTIAAGMVREFALVASSSFSVASADVSGVRVRSFFLSSERPAGERVLDAATHALADFEKRFGPYPYRSLDVAEAALVGGAGGVEYSGLATVASMFYRPPAGGAGPLSALSALAGNEGALGAATDEMREFVVAHEVAHQWWHGLVGSDSRLHPFVDESLAQYSAVLYFEDRYGAARGRASGDRNVRANYQMMRLLGESDGPVDRPVAGSSPISYAGLVYGKGPYYYGALRKQLGSARFFEVLRQYAADHRFGFAGPDDFTALAASRAGSGAAAVHALARRWLHEARGDEDLGKADLAGLLGGLLGGSGSAPSGPHVDAAGINKILQGLGGSDASDAKELEEFLRDFAQ